MVDGLPWPAADAETVWLPAGPHSVEHGPAQSQSQSQLAPRLLRLNGDLKAARYSRTDTIEFSYRSPGRAIAILDRTPRLVELDGSPFPAPKSAEILLPRGQHVVTVSGFPLSPR